MYSHTIMQILVAEGLVCKLGDFGESRDLSDQTMTTVRVAPAAAGRAPQCVAHLLSL